MSSVSMYSKQMHYLYILGLMVTSSLSASTLDDALIRLKQRPSQKIVILEHHDRTAGKQLAAELFAASEKYFVQLKGVINLVSGEEKFIRFCRLIEHFVSSRTPMQVARKLMNINGAESMLSLFETIYLNHYSVEGIDPLLGEVLEQTISLSSPRDFRLKERDRAFVQRLIRPGNEIFLVGVAHAEGIIRGLKEQGSIENFIFVYAYENRGIAEPAAENLQALSRKYEVGILVRNIEPSEDEKMLQLVQEIMHKLGL